jgi:tetratricopeptide (TPR) repeat protein
VKAAGKDSRFSGLALGLVIVGATGALAGLWWTSHWRADVNFLPSMAPAEWVVYPVTPDGNSQPILELPTIFRNSFVLGSVPSKAVLRIAGFHRYTLAINGTVAERPLRHGTDWKRPDLFDVAGQLQPGTNRIEITVFNSSAPPALWLSLDAGGLQINSGAKWQASYAGAAWRAAVPAAAPRPTAAGGPVYRLSGPWIVLGTRWPTLVIFTLLSATGCWLLRDRTFFPPSNPDLALSKPKMGSWAWLRGILPFAVLAGLWMVLFANNLPALPPLTGFDAQAHLDYIRYLQEHVSLPLASQGFEMFQPPLYYLLSAAWLGLLQVSVSGLDGIMALRILGLAIGLTHFVIVWATLRLLFPSERSKVGWGVVLAAFLPPLLYLSQYVTNEAFAAMLVSACVWLTVRALQQERLTWTLCTGLGLCLGAALLAKSTALLVLPLVFGALLWKWLEKRANSLTQWTARMALILALCALVGGWHYARLWVHYGSPLAGNWDPQLGFSWWQYDGYRTSDFYLRFGDALVHPWNSVPQSLGDGIYATLWGDGLLSSAVELFSRPPWNYDLMAIGYWLAVLPAVAVLAGGILAVFTFIRRPSAEWFLLLGFGGLVLWAMAYMSLVVPYSMAKAFYGLPALIPFCAIGALGFDFLTRRSAKLRRLVCVVFGLWAMNNYASLWISRTSVPSAVAHARALAQKGQDREATEFLTEFLRQRLSREPKNAELRFSLAYFLTITGRVDEGMREAEMLLQDDPKDCRGHHVLALASAQMQQAGKAIEELRQVMALAPGYDPSWESFTSILLASGLPNETVSVCQQALAMAPFSPGLRLALGTNLLLLDQDAEGSVQLGYAYRLNPRSVDQLVSLAWKLATATGPAERNGVAAVKLAEHACTLTGYSKTVHLDALAAIYAETGRFADAIRTAERAEASALAAGDSDGAVHSRQLLERLRNGQPWRNR